MKQYGAQIRQTITKILVANGITDIAVHANDKGALDYTIEARTQTAINRALGRGGN
jgi:citrate lyase subunit gamma (acyl carrier protein)